MMNWIISIADKILIDIKTYKTKTGKKWTLVQKLNYIFTIALTSGETA
jgi:hypothetical protein